MFRSGSLVCAALFALVACAGAPSTAESQAVPTTKPETHVKCERPPSWVGGDCSVDEARTATLAELRAVGDTLTVDCGLIGHEIDGAYMEACVRNVRALATELSGKWPAELAPIDAQLLRFDWTEYTDIHVAPTGGGCCIGVGMWWGEATLPLRWREAPTDAQ